MSNIADILDGAEGAFEQLEDQLTVHNYVEASGGLDDYRDATGGTGDAGTKDPHPDSPQTVPGSVDLRGRPSVEARASGLDVEADAVAFIDSEAFLTSGGGTWNGTDVPYPTEIEDRGATYHVVHVFETGTGRTRCLLRSDGSED